MHYQNLEKLKHLRLFGMARALEELQNLADRGQLDFADQLAMMIDRESAREYSVLTRFYVMGRYPALSPFNWFTPRGSGVRNSPRAPEKSKT